MSVDIIFIILSSLFQPKKKDHECFFARNKKTGCFKNEKNKKGKRMKRKFRRIT